MFTNRPTTVYNTHGFLFGGEMVRLMRSLLVLLIMLIVSGAIAQPAGKKIKIFVNDVKFKGISKAHEHKYELFGGVLAGAQ